MREILSEFINDLIIYDYILFGSTLLIFLILIVLTIIFRKKFYLALFLHLIAFSTLIGGSAFGYMQMHNYLFKNNTTLKSYKKLNFTQAIVAYVDITNESSRNFKSCKVTTTIYKTKQNLIMQTILKLKPITKMSIIESDIDVNETRELKFLIEPFTYGSDFNISVGAKCR